jgi:hypothetical protein
MTKRDLEKIEKLKNECIEVSNEFCSTQSKNFDEPNLKFMLEILKTSRNASIAGIEHLYKSIKIAFGYTEPEQALYNLILEIVGELKVKKNEFENIILQTEPDSHYNTRSRGYIDGLKYALDLLLEKVIEKKDGGK